MKSLSTLPDWLAYIEQLPQASHTPASAGTIVPAPKVSSDLTLQLASKDLVFEEDSEAAYAYVKPAAYLRSSAGAKPTIVIKLVLNHQ